MDDIWKEYKRDKNRRTGLTFYRSLTVALVGCIVCVWMPVVFMIVS